MKNETPAAALPESADAKLPDMSWIGLLLGALFCVLAIYSEVRFRHTIMALPPGTGIRPIEHSILELVWGAFALLLGVPCSVLGIAVARVERKPLSVWLGIVGVCVCLLPFPIAQSMSAHTIHTSNVRLLP